MADGYRERGTMTFILENKLLLLLVCFLAGVAATIPLFRQSPFGRAWKIADLVWVVLGGLGALSAVLAEVYAADRTKLDRQIDIAYTTTRSFDRDAARFRLVHCEADRHPGPLRPYIGTLCDRVEFLSASTAENSDLPLFLEITETTVPLRALSFIFGSGEPAVSDGMSRDEMMAEAAQFDPADFLVFAAQDDATRKAMAMLEADPDLAAVGAEYRVIASTYEELIDQVGRLKAEWDYLQGNAQILTFQVVALGLVAFAAPFRLGRSLVALK